MSSDILEPDLNPFNMLLDALRWNMLNVIRVELFFNCYKLWDIFLHSSFKSPRGQYAIASAIITLIAQFTVQFHLNWLLTIYATYLAVGLGVWIYHRVYFYHRRLNPDGVNQTIHHFDASRIAASNASDHGMGTLKKGISSSNGGGSSASSSSSANGDNTNSLQRQRASAYHDFRRTNLQSLLSEPRQNHREFALSLTHLSHISKLVADKDVFDEMHFQVLATRRDVVNILLRAILFLASTLLAYLR